MKDNVFTRCRATCSSTVAPKNEHVEGRGGVSQLNFAEFGESSAGKPVRVRAGPLKLVLHRTISRLVRLVGYH
jgi:hypothetical protein